MPVRKPMAEPAVSDIGVEEINTVTPPANYTSREQPVRKSLIPELYRFVRSIAPAHPYHELVSAAVAAGWVWKLTEDTFYKDEDQCVVRFRVEIGKATSDLDLEYFDHISLMVPKEAPSPSLFARANAATTLIYMVFGRFPPMQQPAPAPAPEPIAEMEPEPEPEPAVPWREPPHSAKPTREPLPDNLIRTRTKDGLPILINLYDGEYDTSEAVDRVITLFEDEADRIDDVAQLRALYTVNKNDTVGAVQYVQDFGSEGQIARLHTIFRQREQQLARRR